MKRLLQWVLGVELVAGIVAGVALVALILPPPTLPRTPCADLVAQAISTPKHPVRGSWDCLDLREQLYGARSGYVGDSGLQQLAADRGYEHARLIGPTDGGYVYELSGVGGAATILIYVQEGLVVRIDRDQAP